MRNVPYFPRLSENNARQGFLADKDYDRLVIECGRVGLWLRTLLALGYSFAWRKSELTNLKVEQVDLLGRTIHLETSKNGDPRTAFLTNETFPLVLMCTQGKQPTDYLFTRDDGKRVLDFRTSWKKACEAAGVSGLLFHDLRRTGARNLRRLGVSEHLAMKFGGWKTRSVFERYDIVSHSDLEQVAALLDAKRLQQKSEQQAKNEAPSESEALANDFSQRRGEAKANSRKFEHSLSIVRVSGQTVGNA